MNQTHVIKGLKDLLRDTFIENYKGKLEKKLQDRLINT